MKLHSRIGLFICTLLWVLLVSHIPESSSTTQANARVQTTSCTHGQGCILVRDWARPWVANFQEHPVRLLESEEKNPGPADFVRPLVRLDRHASQQPTLDVLEPTLAEKTLALLYPYHELG
ncbi:MAG: hypothetical protein ACQER4_10065 [Bacteroidota bacterium]